MPSRQHAALSPPTNAARCFLLQPPNKHASRQPRSGARCPPPPPMLCSPTSPVVPTCMHDAPPILPASQQQHFPPAGMPLLYFIPAAVARPRARAAHVRATRSVRSLLRYAFPLILRPASSRHSWPHPHPCACNASLIHLHSASEQRAAGAPAGGSCGGGMLAEAIWVCRHAPRLCRSPADHRRAPWPLRLRLQRAPRPLCACALLRGAARCSRCRHDMPGPPSTRGSPRC